MGGIKSHFNNNFSFFYKNFEIGKNILISAKENNVKNLINISSGSVYPDLGNKELFESDIFNGN